MYKKLIKIPSGKSVAPGSALISSEWAPIDKIHIIKQIKGRVTIYTGISTVTYDPGAFVLGGVYEMIVHKITFELEADENSIVGLTGKKRKG